MTHTSNKNQVGRRPMLLTFAICVALAVVSAAQNQPTPTTASSSQVSVPHLVKFSGTVKDDTAHPKNGIIGVTFALYKDQQGGAPLWLETQSVQADSKGSYTVLLGSTLAEGLPEPLFTSGEARWLGAQVQGQPEQPRLQLTAAPYALKAVDAETLGGKPASAFMAATSGANSNPTSAITGSGTPNHITKWITKTKIGNSGVFESTAGDVGIGTTTPASKFDLQGKGDVRDTLTLFPAGSDPTLSVSGTAFQISNNGTVSFVSGQTFPGTGDGTITGVTAGTDLTGGGSKGNVTLNVDTTKVAQLNTSNNGTFSIAGSNNSTIVQATQNSGASGIAIAGVAGGTTGIGVEGTGFTGVFGSGLGNSGTGVEGGGSLAGVLGFTNSTSSSSTGVLGQANASSGGATGVLGLSDSGIGVLGNSLAKSGTTYGVLGVNSNPSGVSAGVEGQSFATSGTTWGIVGATHSPNGIGAIALGDGESKLGLGIIGCCAVGVWGDTGQNGNTPAGVVATADDSKALFAANNSPSGLPTAAFLSEGAGASLVAGGFSQSCSFDNNGDLFCQGSKSAVVPVDSGHRQVALYAVESPQNWFEDFGDGRLASGTARISLEPTFAQTVASGTEYHVFLTPRDECEGLFVTNATASGFEVRELHHGHSNVAFDYRIVALRRGYETVRLEDKTEMVAKGKAAMPKPLAKPGPPVLGAFEQEPGLMRPNSTFNAPSRINAQR